MLMKQTMSPGIFGVSAFVDKLIMLSSISQIDILVQMVQLKKNVCKRRISQYGLSISGRYIKGTFALHANIQLVLQQSFISLFAKLDEICQLFGQCQDVLFLFLEVFMSLYRTHLEVFYSILKGASTHFSMDLCYCFASAYNKIEIQDIIVPGRMLLYQLDVTPKVRVAMRNSNQDCVILRQLSPLFETIT